MRRGSWRVASPARVELLLVVACITWTGYHTSVAAQLDKLRPYQQQCYNNSLDGVQPCFLLADSDGLFGCAQCGEPMVQSTVLDTPTANAVTDFLDGDDPVDKRALLLPASVFFQTAVADAILGKREKIAFLLVESNASPDAQPPLREFSADRKFPNVGFTADPASNTTWNPAGTTLAYRYFPFNVFLVSQELAEHVRASAARYPQRRASAQYVVESHGTMWSCGKAAGECLEGGQCMPVGGQSVWSAVGRLNVSVPIVGIGAPMDSDAFFRFNSTGVAAEVASLGVMMAVVEAFGTFWRAQSSPTMAVQPVFFAYNTESFGFAGSDRFFYDVENFECNVFANITEDNSVTTVEDLNPDNVTRFFPGCDSPYIPSLRFKQFAGADWGGFIDISQIGSVRSDQPVFVHQQNAEGSLVRQALDDSFGALLADSNATELPPVLLQSVRKHRPEVPAILITDFDQEFQNPYYHSQFDDIEFFDRQEGHATLCKVANGLTRTLLRLAFPEMTLLQIANVEADCARIDQFVGCLSDRTFNCTLDEEVFGNVTDRVSFDDLASDFQYTSSYVPFSRVYRRQRSQGVKWDLLSSFMALHTAFNVTETECVDTDDCPVVALENNDALTNTSHVGFTPPRCINNVCVMSDTFLHDAFGTGIRYASSENASYELDNALLVGTGRRNGTVTESLWDRSLAFCAYSEDSRTHDVTVFVVGLFVLVLSSAFGYLSKLLVAKLDKATALPAV